MTHFFLSIVNGCRSIAVDFSCVCASKHTDTVSCEDKVINSNIVTVLMTPTKTEGGVNAHRRKVEKCMFQTVMM